MCEVTALQVSFKMCFRCAFFRVCHAAPLAAVSAASPRGDSGRQARGGAQRVQTPGAGAGAGEGRLPVLCCVSPKVPEGQVLLCRCSRGPAWRRTNRESSTSRTCPPPQPQLRRPRPPPQTQVTPAQPGLHFPSLLLPHRLHRHRLISATRMHWVRKDSLVVNMLCFLFVKERKPFRKMFFCFNIYLDPKPSVLLLLRFLWEM